MKFKKNAVAFLLTLVLCAPIAFPRNAMAQTKAWSGRCVSKENIGGQKIVVGGQDMTVGGEDVEVATVLGAECLVVNILNIGVSAVGIASFVMVLVGAVMYLTSGGDPRKTEVGSKTLSYAGFGLLVSISGWVIINFLATFTGVDTIKTLDLKVGE